MPTRRDLLLAVAASSLAAGCSGLFGGDESEPADRPTTVVGPGTTVRDATRTPGTPPTPTSTGTVPPTPTGTPPTPTPTGTPPPTPTGTPPTPTSTGTVPPTPTARDGDDVGTDAGVGDSRVS